MRRLLVDIENSPNLCLVYDIHKPFISIEQIIEPSRILCWGAKWYGEPKVHFKAEYHGRDVMLNELWDLLDQADAVIHYYGKSFDVPKINGEFWMTGRTPPSPYQQIDLYETVRKMGLPSNKLDYALRVRGLPRKASSGGMANWKAVMAGDAKAWAKAKSYNIQDVKAMEPLYEDLLPWISGHPSFALETGRHVCTRCGSPAIQRRGTYVTAVSVYQRWQCQECGGWSRTTKRDNSTNIREVAA